MADAPSDQNDISNASETGSSTGAEGMASDRGTGRSQSRARGSSAGTTRGSSATKRSPRPRSDSGGAQSTQSKPSNEAPPIADSSARSGAPPEDDWQADVASLSFLEARTALELVMARLQSDALEVEEMAGLYRRAEAFAQRCEAVLNQVEQDVIEWEADAAVPAP